MGRIAEKKGKMKQLGQTSIEQFKKLIEAGLDPNTADNKSVPCWSLGALIELLPKTIETKKPKNLYFPEILPSNNCVAYTALNENKEYVFLKLFATGVESDATLIDNMVSMICWLLENNYIKRRNKNERRI